MRWTDWALLAILAFDVWALAVALILTPKKNDWYC